MKQKVMVGEIVQIVGNSVGHEFEIGERVRVRVTETLDDGSIDKAEHLDGSDWWCVSKEDIKRARQK